MCHTGVCIAHCLGSFHVDFLFPDKDIAIDIRSCFSCGAKEKYRLESSVQVLYY